MVITSIRYYGILRATHTMGNMVELRLLQAITLSIAE
jgi:hypothetical protein